MLLLNKTQNEMIYVECVNKVQSFYSTDSKEEYSKNRRLLRDTQYHSTPIEYKFNNLGYRTKNIENLDISFLLTFGCSYTEGVGLHQQDTWAEKIAKHLNLDLYNHAKQSSGMDIQFYNALLWNMSNKPKPKIVIAQWPHKARKSFGYRTSDGIEIKDPSYTKTPDGKWWSKRYVQDSGEMELNNLFWFESFNNVWNMNQVPVLNFTWDSDLLPNLVSSSYNIFRINPKNRDKARDLQHDGVLFHNDTTERLKEILERLGLSNQV